MKKMLIKMLTIGIVVYALGCVFLYFFQERLIFLPQKLDEDHLFSFENEAEELNVFAPDSTLINGLLFKADNSKGLIFYLHGNAGNLNSWGEVAKTYTDLNYDVYMLDYRGYGKSEGEIVGQEQLFADNQLAYNVIKERYSEKDIIVLGYSIGSGLAAKLASTNMPKLLILQAPYYSLTDMMSQRFPFVPTFLLKYKFETNSYLESCAMPVVIFHGDQDEVIYYGSSEKLKAEFKSQDTLITLQGQGHNGMTNNSDYKISIAEILEE